MMTGRTVVRRVRLTPEEDEQLARLAKERNADVSKVIREAIGLLDKEARRLAAYDRMIELAQMEQKKLKGRKPPKERWSLK
jgi:predicted transcriptional regulator